jgi:hypothetical protein
MLSITPSAIRWLPCSAMADSASRRSKATAERQNGLTASQIAGGLAPKRSHLRYKSLALWDCVRQKRRMNIPDSPEPRFQIEGPNGSGRAVLIIDADRADLGPWEEAATVMSRWLETTAVKG